MLIWLFVVLIMPATAVVGTAHGATVDAVYDSYSSPNANGSAQVWTQLNGVGISTVVFYVVGLVYTLIFSGIYLFYRVRERTKVGAIQAVWYTDFALLWGTSFVFFVVAMIQPNVQPLTANWAVLTAIQKINGAWSATGPVSASLQALIMATAQEMHLATVAPTGPAGWANLVQQINTTALPTPTGHLTPLWDNAGSVVTRSAGWGGIAGLFGVVLSLLFLLPTGAELVTYLSHQERKNYRKMAQEMMRNYRTAVAEKREIRKKKKSLLEKEDRLWASLEEIDPKDKNESAIERLSQYELEEKIAKTNELKEEIELLRQQREEIQGQRKKKKPASYRQSTRNKKQKIAVPDEELEDIFKSLDL